MHIQPINNQTFGRVYLRESSYDYENKKETHKIYPAQPLDVNKVGQKDLFIKGTNLVDRVIECDYDTVELRKRYNQLLDEQMKNPNNIMIDVFLSHVPEPEDFFQIAYVGKKAKVFKQAEGYYPWQRRPSTIDFLEDACKYANKLARK
jgi:hypothetical protein